MDAIVEVTRRPGSLVLVRFEGDPGFWHERLLLARVGRAEERWIVLTGDSDMYAERLSDWVEALPINGGYAYPGHVEGHVVQFSHPLSRAELGERILEGRKLAKDLEAAEGLGASPLKTDALDWNGERFTVDELGLLGRLRRRVTGKTPELRLRSALGRAAQPPLGCPSIGAATSEHPEPLRMLKRSANPSP